MATIQETSELAWLQVYPNGGDETPISKEEFIETAKSEFAYQQLLMAWQEKATEGYFNVPSYLLEEVEKEVVNNEIDISDLKVLMSLPQEVWLQNVGGISCKCEYVKTTVNLAQALCGDDSMGDNVKRYYVIGKKIKFPDGAHLKTLPIIYANSGENVDGYTEIDDALAGILRRKLIEIYAGKTGNEDVTNNSNSQK